MSLLQISGEKSRVALGHTETSELEDGESSAALAI
jgi:hypothetical protein